MNATTQDEVRDALANHKVLVDTCFVMDRNFPKFLQDYQPVLKSNPLLVPARVVQELGNIEKKNDHRKPAVSRAQACISSAVEENLAVLRGEVCDYDKLADNVISRVVEQHMASNDLVVLTNDRGLKDDLYAKLSSTSFSTRHSLLVIRFGPNRGTPHVWGRPSKSGGRKRPKPTSTDRKRYKPKAGPNPFSVTRTAEQNTDAALAVTEDIGKTAVVTTYDGDSIQLRSKLGSGGEGDVYETDRSGVLCKVYHAEKLTAGRQKKTELMLTRKVAHAGICWPLESVRDSHGVFRGFLMQKAVGAPLGHGLYIPTVWMQNHADWTRKESVRLVITILEGINYLHRMNVLLGDINPMNILVKNENNVFFVDCDSFQVEGFPCPVGSVNFVAPEIQGQDFRHFLRTREHEEFAVATLVFMIMMPGKPPFSHQGGADGAANIRKMHFPYPLGEKGSSGAPEGAWRFCWSHLTRAIKELFHQTFHIDCADQSRPSVSDWLRAFRDYERILKKPDASFQGPQPQFGFDLSILPQNFRYVEDKNTLPSSGETDLQRSVRRMAANSRTVQQTAGKGSQRTSASTTPHRGTSRRSQASSPRRQTAAPTTSPAASAGAPTGSTPGNANDWLIYPVTWPIIAQLKAVAAVLLAGILGCIVGAIALGFLSLVGGALFYGDGYAGLQFGIKWGAILGGSLGAIAGAFAEAVAIMDVAESMPWAAGIGGVVGAVALALIFRSAWWAIPGIWVGLTVGLGAWRATTEKHLAFNYLHKWWWHS